MECGAGKILLGSGLRIFFFFLKVCKLQRLRFFFAHLINEAANCLSAFSTKNFLLHSKYNWKEAFLHYILYPTRQVSAAQNSRKARSSAAGSADQSCCLFYFLQPWPITVTVVFEIFVFLNWFLHPWYLAHWRVPMVYNGMSYLLLESPF